MTLRNVSFFYQPKTPVLSGINLHVGPGERLILLGANGAGKSTFLSLLNGLNQPCSGELLLDGEAIRYDRSGLRNLRARVATVMQDPDDQLFADTPLRDVALGLLEAGIAEPEARETASAALSQMGVGHLADRSIYGLSLGEKKRVALAGVLVLRPEYLLLDEPTAGLDWPGTVALLEIMRTLCEAGTAIVAATHDTDAMLGWASRAIVLGSGRLVGDVNARTLERNWDQHTNQCGLRPPARREEVRR